MRGDARVFNILALQGVILMKQRQTNKQKKNAVKVIFLSYFNGKENMYRKEHNNTIG